MEDKERQEPEAKPAARRQGVAAGTSGDVVAATGVAVGSLYRGQGDWHGIDLHACRRSDSLTAPRISDKVGKLRGMKSLRTPETTDVDASNRKFSSNGGALYDKDGKTLCGVPRSYGVPPRIKEGTENVLFKIPQKK